MKKIFYLPILISGLGLGINQLEAAEQCSTIGSTDYYRVTHIDMRKCASPMCGGYYVQRVNQAKTLCADGRWQKECHVFQLNAQALGWNAQQTTDYFQKIFGEKRGIVRGQFAHALDANFSQPIDTLTIVEAWQTQSITPAKGLLYRLKDSGIQCPPTMLCLSVVKQTLNAWQVKDSLIAPPNLDKTGASAEAVATATQQLAKDGIIVAATHQANSRNAANLLVNQLYLPVENTTRIGQACGGVVGTVCSAGQFCELPPNSSASAGGVCQNKPEICTMDYRPVCGQDGITYGNDCGRRAAGVPIAYVGECSLQHHEIQ
ncbi:MAG: hypothetical protein RL637_1424 [Pseudomonadota bacterium]|jgi:hypothetical protein